MYKVRIIERSLHCYTLGWLAFLPVAGLAFGPLALLSYQSVRVEAGKDWNPASRYLHCGALLGCLGFLVSVLLLGLLFLIILKSVEN